MSKDLIYFTSESVSEGHPDKMADQISDAVLDAMIAQDPMSRVACETLISTGMCVVAGEVTTHAHIDIPQIVRNTIKEIGYTKAEYGFDYEHCAVMVSLGKQSADISQGVSEGQGLHQEAGAGDQGMMFGYACNETPELMPLPIMMAHQLVKKLAELRKTGQLPYLRPDSKSQVTVAYQNWKPVGVTAVVLSTQHDEDVAYETIRKDLIEKVINVIIPANMLKMLTDEHIHINPTGRFVIGGPHGDCGLTGRKIIVDTYGGMARHGGGAFSGKDPTKVDRSAAYMARYVAKNIVAAGLADRCEIQVAYAIGVAKPLSVYINTFDTAKINEEKIAELVTTHFDLTPKGIIEKLDLRKPIYQKTAAYGHFGQEGSTFSWEKTDKAALLQKAAGLS